MIYQAASAGLCSLKRIRHSRLYLNFSDPAEVYKFRAQFSGHAFVNKKGAQYKCTVEFAPYQKVPREKAKEDSREGTYEKGELNTDLPLSCWRLQLSYRLSETCTSGM